MINIATAINALSANLLRQSLGIVLLLLLLTGSASGQSSTDGFTPPALTPGAPAGSFPLSDLDTVNLFNGNLNFSLPLLKVGGRGGAQTSLILKIEQKWRIEEIASCSPCGGFFYPTYNWWTARTVGYGPGLMEYRTEIEGDNSCDTNPFGSYSSLLRLTFTTPDGTEYELRDKLTNGQPLPATTCNPGIFRGREFVTADGTSATYISDADIRDDGIGFSSGFLIMRDGTRYRIENGGLVMWMRDRNGNRMNFTYDANGRVATITDSLGRVVTIAYDVQDGAPYGLCDRITYQGFGGATRIIRVSKANLGTALRSGYVLKSYFDLFPELSGSSTTCCFNAEVKTAVWMPDGRSYRFYYNSYGELARAELPTGGAVEYDYDAEFYERGCQEKTSPHLAPSPFFLSWQPAPASLGISLPASASSFCSPALSF